MTMSYKINKKRMCTIVLTSGPRKHQLCERPCRNDQSICTMHSNLVIEITTWDQLSKAKQKQCSKDIDDIIENGTWTEEIIPLLTRYQLQHVFTGNEIERCIQAFRASHTKRSITYKNNMMYVSDLHKGRCIKVTEGVPELTMDQWKRILGTLTSKTQTQFLEEVSEMDWNDMDALFYHYRLPTTSFLWNEHVQTIVRSYVHG